MKIPISRIRPNPNNPRHVIKPSALDGLAANIKSVGRLLNPIKVRELTAAEKAEDPEHDYEIISGHLRFYACQKLGWTEIDAIIRKYGSLAEKFDEEVGDNIDKDMMWLEWYEVIGEMLKINPKLTQKEVADRLGVSQQDISEASRVLPILNKGAREAIYCIAVKSKD